MLKTFKISFSGQVQGVGFRPFIYNLAHQFSLKGTISNNEQGVIIFITGQESNVLNFYHKTINFPPPVAKIKSYNIIEIDLKLFDDFKIVSSNKAGKLNLPLTPDFAICENCKNDIENPDNLRYNYPFTNCVNCGPRWAITKTFPFERDNTRISDFPMCNSCKEEYKNPANRRFHSQTNTCSNCGISLYLKNSNGKNVDLPKDSIFEFVANQLKEGKIIAVKNTSGYLLCCDAQNKDSIKNLRLKKNRPKKPFAVLFPSLIMLQQDLKLSKKQINSLTSSQSPINIVSLDKYSGKIDLGSIAPGLNQIGVMLPYSGILQLISNNINFPIVATSGNIHGSPIIKNDENAIEKLKEVADYFLQHNLIVEHPQDDSVVKFSMKFEHKILFRRSRGYAPNFSGNEINSNKKILAMGAHLKSTIAFYPNSYLYISQYLGNLDNFDVYNRFTKTVSSFINIFEQQPEIILVDKHPHYQSTQYGKELSNSTNEQLFEIQHHKAHFAAVLGENNLFEKRVLGVVFDGTGLGDDDNIWGGEFFEYKSSKISRIENVEYFNWILGDKMAKEPRLSLLSLSSPEMNEILKEKFTENELKNYQFVKSQNKLKTSSVGRLFDAVASLLGITDFNTYEGEAAILLENLVLNYNLANCKSYLRAENNKFSAYEIVENIFIDLQNGVSKETCILNFLYTLAYSILEIAKSNNFSNIACSGGVFQNSILVDMLIELAPKDVNLYFHKSLSPNDENICFGQLMYYLHIKDPLTMINK